MKQYKVIVDSEGKDMWFNQSGKIVERPLSAIVVKNTTNMDNYLNERLLNYAFGITEGSFIRRLDCSIGPTSNTKRLDLQIDYNTGNCVVRSFIVQELT